MEDIYEFQDDHGETSQKATNTDNSLRYEMVKKKVGFCYWSIEDDMRLTVDGKDIEDKLREIYPMKQLGRIIPVEPVDHLCVQIRGSSGNKCVMALYDFLPVDSQFSSLLDIASTESFCATVEKQMTRQFIDEIDEQQVEEMPEFHQDSVPDESIETEAVVNSNQAENKRHEHFSKETTNETKNTLIQEAASNKLGEFAVPINAIKIAVGDEALRALSSQHIKDIRNSLQVDYENGHQPSLPIAVGMIDFDDDWTSDEAKQLIEAGDIPVTLIDGNHTHEGNE